MAWGLKNSLVGPSEGPDVVQVDQRGSLGMVIPYASIMHILYLDSVKVVYKLYLEAHVIPSRTHDDFLTVS